MIDIKFKLVMLVAVFGLGLPSTAFAAGVSFEPASLTANQAKPYATTLVLNTDGQSLNAISGQLILAKELGQDIIVSDSGSVVTYWVERPTWDPMSRTIAFSGAVPGGYSGQNGILFSIILPARLGYSLNNAIMVSEVSGYLNDGLATPVVISKKTFSINSEGSASINPEISEQLYINENKPDNIPPEPFSPQVARQDEVFDGKWFISFSTTDKQSGVSHYEIQESRSGRVSAANWIRAESPYVLQDQDLHSFIYVVAVDRQGNERMIKVFPRKPLTWWQRYGKDIGIIGSLILLVVAGALVNRKTRNSKRNKNEV